MKRVVTILLLVVVVAALLPIFKQDETSDLSDKTITTGSVVYYFHSSKRCPTCNKLEQYALETLKKEFAAPLENNRLFWSSLNFQEPENAHFVKDFGLSFQMVVLTRYEEGKIVRFKKLDKIWELVNDKQAYSDYIRSEVAEFYGGLIK